MRTVFFFFPVQIKTLPVQKNWNCARAKKKCPWKKLKNPKKVPVKKQICPCIFSKIMPVQLKKVHVQKNKKYAREKSKSARKKVKFLPVQTILPPVQKTKKSARAKKSGREKSEKWGKKWAWKSKSARAKIEKMAKNGLHGHFSLARGRKKKTLGLQVFWVFWVFWVKIIKDSPKLS